MTLFFSLDPLDLGLYFCGPPEYCLEVLKAVGVVIRIWVAEPGAGLHLPRERHNAHVVQTKYVMKCDAYNLKSVEATSVNFVRDFFDCTPGRRIPGQTETRGFNHRSEIRKTLPCAAGHELKVVAANIHKLFPRSVLLRDEA
jgi:hypothetical protein